MTRIVLLASFAMALTAKADTRPNIIFIMADDHASQAIGAYGSKVNTTPNIDRIAREGVRLDRCFVTNSICTPSRAAILTGKYSHVNGVPVFNRFDGSQPTVAKALQAAGYHTGMIGKWHLGSDPTGFDRWTILPGQGDYHNPVMLSPNGAMRYKGYTTDIIGNLGMEFLRDRPRDRPFFLMLHHKAPHRNWEPDEVHRKKWEKVEVPEPDPSTFDDDYAGRSDAANAAEMRIDRDLTPNDLKQRKPPEGLSPKDLKKWKYQTYMRDYLACVDSVDESVGQVLNYLDDQGIAGNTLVIYSSDQGFFLGEHGWFDKRFMYEESLRMPFVARWPAKIAAGRTSDAITLNVDFAPTFLAAAGLPIPPEIQGRNALQVLEGEAPKDWRKSMYYRYYDFAGAHRVQQHYGVRTDRHKLIYYPKLDQWELFDLKDDPRELKNLYADPTQAATVTELKAELAKLKASLGDRDQYMDNIPPGGVDNVLNARPK